MLLNISRSKSNQAMKFGQLIKYNMSAIFLRKSCTKCGEETIFRPLNIKIDDISLDKYSKIL